MSKIFKISTPEQHAVLLQAFLERLERTQKLAAKTVADALQSRRTFFGICFLSRTRAERQAQEILSNRPGFRQFEFRTNEVMNRIAEGKMKPVYITQAMIDELKLEVDTSRFEIVTGIPEGEELVEFLHG